MNSVQPGFGPALVAADGLIFVLAFVFGTYFTWSALSVVKWDKFLFDPMGNHTRLLRILLGIIGGFFFGVAVVALNIALQAMRILI